jgi:hypothetical protein
MGKIIFYFVLALLLRPFSIVAQLNTLNATKTLLKGEKNRFFRELSKSQLDPNITSSLKHFAVFEVDSLQEAIISDNTTNDAEKEKAIRSLFNFLKVLSNNIYQPKLEMYDIPGIMESYKSILRSLLHHKPINDELSKISRRIIAGKGFRAIPNMVFLKMLRFTRGFLHLLNIFAIPGK